MKATQTPELDLFTKLANAIVAARKVREVFDDDFFDADGGDIADVDAALVELKTRLCECARQLAMMGA